MAEAKVNEIKDQRIKKREDKLIQKNEGDRRTHGGEHQGKKSQWGPLEGVCQ